MTQRIHPDSMKEPYTLHEIRRMVKSWRGVPRSQVPESVKIIDLLDGYAAHLYIEKYAKEVELQELADDYDEMVRLSEASLVGFRQRVQKRAEKVSNHMIGVGATA